MGSVGRLASRFPIGAASPSRSILIFPAHISGIDIVLKEHKTINMKKNYCLFTILIIFCFTAFGEESEELDFLLFMPNSSSRFVNQERAVLQLDNLANYIMERDLLPAQIIVHGYAAAAENDIDPVALSGGRAMFVINELEKRGVSKDLFSDPAAHGSVALWGNNASEENRIQNRRVIILIDGSELAAAALETFDSVSASEPSAIADTGNEAVKRIRFPWWFLILFLLAVLITALLFLLPKKRKERAGQQERAAEKAEMEQQSPAVSEKQPPLPELKYIYLSEEEIRRRAYSLFEYRCGMNGDAEGDWYEAIRQLCAEYEAAGYIVRLVP